MEHHGDEWDYNENVSFITQSKPMLDLSCSVSVSEDATILQKLASNIKQSIYQRVK